MPEFWPKITDRKTVTGSFGHFFFKLSACGNFCLSFPVLHSCLCHFYLGSFLCLSFILPQQQYPLGNLRAAADKIVRRPQWSADSTWAFPLWDLVTEFSFWFFGIPKKQPAITTKGCKRFLNPVTLLDWSCCWNHKQSNFLPCISSFPNLWFVSLVLWG